MKARLWPILLAGLLLIFALSVPASAADVPFSDVADSAWYYESVERVYEKNWMNGTGNDRFSPDDSLTRAMLAVILWRIEGSQDASRTVTFTDTSANAWYADGLSWCAEKGLFAGYPNGSFGPDDAVTREQLAIVFFRYAEKTGAVPSGQVGHTTFKNGCPWAADACDWANEHGLFTDAIGTLDLCAPASRAEIAYLLDQYFPSEASPSALTENSFDSMGYLLYTPANAQPDMPLIVYLHGGHGKGSDLSVLTTTDGFPQYLQSGQLGDVRAYVVIPQLPSTQKGWVNAAESISELIDHTVSTYKINRNNISLTGHSMGGTGTWNLACTYPSLFARIAPLSGSIRNTPDIIDNLKNIPVRAFVGSADTIVPPDSSKEVIAALI